MALRRLAINIDEARDNLSVKFVWMALRRLAINMDEAIEKNMDEILLQRDLNHSKVVFTEFRRCSLYVPSANQILEK